MAKSLTSVDEYDADPARVFAMITDPEFLLAKYEATGQTSASVLERGETSAGGARVRTQRDIEAAGIPDLARKVLGNRQTIVEDDEWGAAGADGSRTGTWKVATKGAPVSMKGTFELRPAGGGTVVRIAGEAKVTVPLVGGKIEGVVVEAVQKQLQKEREFGRQWLAR